MGEIEELVYREYIEPFVIEENGKKSILVSSLNLDNFTENERLMIKIVLEKHNISLVEKTNNTPEDNVKKIKEQIFNNKIKPIIYKDSTGGKYVLRTDIGKLNFSIPEMRIVDEILSEQNIDIMDEIKVEDRPKLVRDFEYGKIREARINPAEENKYATIIYDKNGEIESVDYSELNIFLEEIFIPENLHIKVRLRDVASKEYYSIQLNRIVKLKLSEMEFKYVMEYLSKQGIIVCGTSEYPNEEFGNYDFFNRPKNIQIPDSISKEKNKELFIRLNECNDEKEYAKIRDEIIVGNMRLAKWVIYKLSYYYGIDSSWDTYAYEGLIKAVEEYDIDKGASFSTFAFVVIKNYVKRCLADYLKIPVNLFEDFFRAKKIVELDLDRKYKKGDREMLDKILELLESVGRISPVRRNSLLVEMLGATKSYEDEDMKYVYSAEEIPNLFDSDELRSGIDNALNTLTDREKRVLILRFGLDGGEPQTFDEVGAIFGVSRERIRQIEAKALRKMRHPSRVKMMVSSWKNVSDMLGMNATNANAGYMETSPSNPDSDEYIDSEQFDMESDTYVDPLEQLDEFYKEEDEKRR